MEQKESVPEVTIPESVEVVKEKVSKLEVVPNWKKIFLTWSFAFHLFSIVLTFVDQLLPFFGLLEPTMSTNTYAVSMFCLNALGLFSRFIKQKKLWEYPASNGNG